MIMLGFYGHSNSGKTTVIEGLVRTYRRRGLSVAVIKHTAHRGFELDMEGSDSWRHGKAGANAVGLLSDDNAAVLINKIPGRDKGLGLIVELVRNAVSPEIVFLEGFKHAGIEKVAVGNIARLPGTIAGIRGPNDMAGIRRLGKLVGRMLRTERIMARLGGADCGRCGLDCDAFAERVASGKKKMSECKGRSDTRLDLTVDETAVNLTSFPKQMVAAGILGLLAALKMPSGESIGSRRRSSIDVHLRM
jgi:molybdopterin-guanine dinucleotide biosynthesis protein MobB